MTSGDARLRSLEREALTDPLVRERLDEERFRAGLGWHGERMPGGVIPKRTERWIYGRTSRAWVPGSRVSLGHPDCAST